MIETLLDSGSRLYDYLEPGAVRKLFDEHSSGRCDNHKVLLILIVLEEWMRTTESPVAVWN